MTCVKEARIEELGMKILLESIGVEMDELEGLFGSYEDRYASFAKSAERRRKMRKEFEEGVEKNTKAIIKQLSAITGDEEADKRDPDRMAFYQQCKDTFNAFDKDGSGKLDS